MEWVQKKIDREFCKIEKRMRWEFEEREKKSGKMTITLAF